jgi:hypothetical protein
MIRPDAPLKFPRDLPKVLNSTFCTDVVHGAAAG